MILEEIAAKRMLQLKREKSDCPQEEVERAAKAAPLPKDFRGALKKGEKHHLSVIAEVKRSSPSKGVICENFQPVQTARSYERAGADAVSVLTEEAYFGGSSDVLRQVRAAISLPILRKDFILDPYQIFEARAIGADAILLIAALLEDDTLREFKKLADSLDLSCLMEAHNEEELERVLQAGASIVGINNRDLKTFHVDVATTARLAKKVPPHCVLVSESGMVSAADMREAQRAGAHAVLIGETLMRSKDPSQTLKELRDAL